MAYIDNTDTKKEMNDAIRGNAVSNLAPTKIIDSVQPVININPKDYRRCNIVKSSSKTTTGAQSIYTTPSDKDFYLSGAILSMSKDATCDGATSGTYAYLSAQIQGVAGTAVIALTGIVTTAQDKEISISFPNPILIDRNTNITISGVAYTAGLMVRSATIFGYTVEP